MRVVRYLVAGPLATLGLLLALTSTAAAAGPDPDATLTLTKPVQITTLSKETPIPTGGISYYCAVGTFVPFDDLPGWKPVSASFLVDNAPSVTSIGDAPYDDLAEINGLLFAPVGGAHQVQYRGFSYGQGGNPNVLTNCANVAARSDARYSDTATVTYEHTAACSSAISRLLLARKAVTRAAKRAANTEGRSHVAAVKALKRAKAKLAKANTGFRQKCR